MSLQLKDFLLDATGVQLELRGSGKNNITASHVKLLPLGPDRTQPLVPIAQFAADDMSPLICP